MKLSELAKTLQDYANQFEDAEVTSYQCILETDEHTGPTGKTSVLVIETNPSRTCGGG
jgi:hypothetical protein